MTQSTWTESMDGSKALVGLFPHEYREFDLDQHARMAAPVGGYIVFQHGPIADAGENGTTIEVVTQVLINRLRGFNEGPFRCRENSLAITHLEEALHWLEARTKARQAQSVEGRNVPHVS